MMTMSRKAAHGRPPYIHKNSNHPLAKWRFTRAMSGEVFIQKLRKYLPRGVSISPSTLSRYEAGHIMRPTPELVVAIGKLTEGAITYEHLCRPPKPVRRRARSNP